MSASTTARRGRSAFGGRVRAMRRLLAIGTLVAAGTGSIRAQPPFERLTIVAPAAPGGGWDQTARAMQHALEAEGLVRAVQVENVPGAAGTIGLAQFVTDPPRRDPALLVTGLVMLGAIVFNDSESSLAHTTPIAGLTGEYEVLAVPAASPIRDVRDLADRFRANPAAISWAGGSAGGTDHILAGLIATAARVDPALVNYIPFSGGGEAVAALLGGQVTVAISGYGEFAPHIGSGGLRALAISAPARQPGIDVPTLVEQGLDVTLSNWRGVVAPPALDPASRQQLTGLVAAMARSATWQRTLRERGWSDQFRQGEDLRRFLDDERIRVTRIARSLRPASPVPAAASRMFPAMVVAGAAVVGTALVVQYARGRSRGRPLATPSVVTARPLVLTALALMLYPIVFTIAGFAVAAAALFWVVAVAFDNRHRFRDGLIALAFVTAVHVAFTRGLGMSLPFGWLGEWIR